MTVKRLAILLLTISTLACDDQIFPELPPSDQLVSIDAWLDNIPGPQVIRVQRSQNYFANTALENIDGAQVTVTDDQGEVFNFTQESNGEYVYVPPGDSGFFGSIGRTYFLEVIVDGITYSSSTTLNRVAPIDSITFRFEEEDNFLPDSYFGELWARDPVGLGDTYWIKTWKNGIYLNKPGEINVAFDAAFSEGGNVDGVALIVPIREGINPFEQDDNGDFLSPYRMADTLELQGSRVFRDEEPYAVLRDDTIFYQVNSDSINFVNQELADDLVFEILDPERFIVEQNRLIITGDSVYVEIHSISNDAHFFLTQVQIETDRAGGFGELFASPLANVSTNIISSDPDQEVLGFFNVAAVSAMGKRLRNQDAVRVEEF